MATQTLAPTTLVDDDSIGDVAWTNPADAALTSGAGATCTQTTGQQSHGLNCTHFGYTIPSDGTITDVMLDYEFEVVGDSGNSLSAQLMKAGSPVGTPKTDAYAVQSYTAETLPESPPGGLWGTTLTPADVNATGFGVQLFTTAGADSTTNGFRSVKLEVTYTLPPNFKSTGGSPTVSVSGKIKHANFITVTKRF